MKKLFFYFILMMGLTISCQAGNDDIGTNENKNEISNMKNAARGDVKMWDRPSDNPYELDGYYHINSNDGTMVYMGEVVKPSFTEESKIAIDVVNSGETGRRKGNITCSVSYNGMDVSLVTVSGDGQPSTHWIVYSVGGEQYAFEMNSSTVTNCMALHIQAWIS